MDETVTWPPLHVPFGGAQPQGVQVRLSAVLPAITTFEAE
jgi:hypothetical protein